MKVFLIGDSHGNINFLRTAIKHAKEMEADLIIQLGDFGYWEHTDNGHWFLSKVNRMSLNVKIPFYWIDGNHENHTLLRKKYSNDSTSDSAFLDGEFYHSELWPIRSSLFYMPRGSIHSINGHNFMAFGGSYSIDKSSRRVGTSWWPEEMPTIQDLDKAIETYDNFDGDIHTLLSHDAPYEADMHKLLSENAYSRIFKDAEHVRKTITNLVYKIHPDTIFHGHYHVKCEYDIYCNGKETKCFSLGADGDELYRNTMVIDI